MNNIASLSYFGGEFVLLGGAILVLFSDLVFRNKKWIGFLALAVTAASAAFFRRPEIPVDLFYGFFRLDSFTVLFRGIVSLVIAITIILSLNFRPLKKKYLGEYYSLLLFAGFGLILMASSRNLLMIFLSIEFVSIVSYLLTGFMKDDAKSKEASLKYLLFGSTCSGLMLYGMSFLYGLSGSLDIASIRSAALLPGASQVTFLAMLLVFAGIGFKISMAPFHMWAPDVYEGAPSPVTAFLTVGPKALGFAVLIRLLQEAFADFSVQWANIFIILSIVTMTAGNLTAIAQSNIKRLLAYSSIAHAGYILIGLAVCSPAGREAVVFYLLAYIFTNLGVFAAVIAAEGENQNYDISFFAGLSKRSPFLAASMTLFLLSLAGIPPLAGFVGKFFILAAAVEKGQMVLAVAAVVNSVLSVFYYFKVIRVMYFIPGGNERAAATPFPLRLALWIAMTGTILLGVAPAPVLSMVRHAVPF